MKKFLWMIGLLASLPVSEVMAQENLKLTLSDGSVLTGFISSQHPGTDFTVTSSRAVISLPDTLVLSIFDEDVPFDKLSSEWQKWAEENDAVKVNGASKYVTLSNVSTSTSSVSKVRVLERGAFVKYLEIGPNVRPIAWKNVKLITADKRPKLQLSGINRAYNLFSGGEVKGQYVEEVPGEKIILLGDDGIMRSVKTDNIRKDTRYGVNSAQSLIEQSDLLDVVFTKNNSSFKGVIFEKNYDDKDYDKDYLMIMPLSGNPQSIKINDILEYRKEKNPDYRPLTDIKLADDEGAVCREIGKFRPVKLTDGFLSFSVDSVPVCIKPTGAKTQVYVEAKGSDVNAAQWRLVKVRRVKEKKSKDYTYGFSFEDLVLSPINPASTLSSPNGVKRFDYTIDGTGLFGLYDPNQKRILLFYVSNDMSTKK